MVFQHLVVKSEEHCNGLDVGIFLEMLGKVDHYFVRFLHILAA